MIINYDPTIFNPSFLEEHGNILHDMYAKVERVFYEYELPHNVIQEAIHDACLFLGLHDVPFDYDNEVCIYTRNPTTYSDDIIGINKEKLFQLDIHNKDNLSLIMTHETVHGLLQYISATGDLSPWQEELICDTFMGVRAAVENLSSSRVEEGLSQTPASDTHPYGELRVKYIGIGKEIAEELLARDLPVSAENILSRINDYLKSDYDHIHEQEMIHRELSKLRL